MNQSSFLKYFPVPKYLQFPAVGFDISDGSVKFIELIRTDDVIMVGKFGHRSFGADIVGTLSIIQKQHGFNVVNISIPEEESFFARMQLPYIKSEEIRGAIELQIEEYIPYPANEVEFDYEILRSDPRPGGYIDVNIAALPKKILQHYFDIFRHANFTPQSFMVEADATAKAVVSVDSKEAVMVIKIGRINTVLSIVSGGSVWFSYTFKFGGDLLVKRLEETFHLKNEDAEKLKDGKGLINSASNQEVFGCLLPVVSSVRDETRKHLRYWSENREGIMMAQGCADISRVVLCGSQSMMPGLTNYLSTALGLRVELANPWVNTSQFDRYIPPINYKDSLEYTTAIGLALSCLK